VPVQPPPLITEPVSEEDYYLQNDRDETLRVSATTVLGGAPVALLEDTIPAGSEVHILHAVEGTGHALPSNMFGSFRVESDSGVVYEGVRDDDWVRHAHGLLLTIPRDSQPAALDYSCEQASDCEVKDVGNCCGYYPRCVNRASVPPRVECGDGIGGVCGWPDITHCECVDNTCRSMQGDQEV
jgi:hypothetical protein